MSKQLSVMLLTVSLAFICELAVADTPLELRTKSVARVMAQESLQSQNTNLLHNKELQVNKVTNEEAPSSKLMRLVQGLGVCLSIFFLGIYLYKRYVMPVHNSSAIKQLKVLERLAVTHKTQLVLVQLGSETRLLSVGTEQVTALDSLDQKIDQVVAMQWDKAPIKDQEFEIRCNS